MSPLTRKNWVLLKNNMVWKGVIIEESLEDKSLLNLVKVIQTEKVQLEGENRFVTFHKIELDDNNKKEFIERAIKSIKQGFYLHICDKGVMYVVFKDHMFKFSKDYPELEVARQYGKSIGILEEQMPFEKLIDNPWD